MTWHVAALYRFTQLDKASPGLLQGRGEGLRALQARIKAACLENGLCGTLLLAPEGINGTIAAPDLAGLERVLDVLDTYMGIRQAAREGAAACELKFSTAAEKPFLRMKVRLKKEIVTLQAPEADPGLQVGAYVAPQDWNALIADPSVTLIDTRNKYETAVGIFQGAIDPEIDSFTAFKNFVREKMDPEKQKKVAMFCTGGIRCEKASSYMLAHGFEEVYHLKGGILKYLETVPADQSRWEGECFVFDRRVALGQDLCESPYQICYGCRYPLSAADMQAPAYEEGVSCPHCIDGLSPEKALAFRARHRQMQTRSTVEEGLEAPAVGVSGGGGA